MHPFYLFRDNESEGAVRVDRFPDFAPAIHTVNILTANFVGTVTIEATIKLDPQTSDWFTVHVEDFAPLSYSEEKRRSRAVNLTGRFIHMRAIATNAEGVVEGRVDRVTVI